MKMNTKTISLEESGLNIRDGRNMIFSIIDNQINNYKLKFLSNWEENHTISSEEKDRKIDQLKLTKESLNDFFNN